MPVYQYKGHEFESDHDLSPDEWTQTLAHLDSLGPAKSQAMQGLEAIEPSAPSISEEKPRFLDYLSAPIEAIGSVVLGSIAQGLANIPAAAMDVTGIGDPDAYLKEANKWIPKATSELGQQATHAVGQVLDPLNAVMPNLQMMHALAPTGPIVNRFRKQTTVDPKLDAALSESELLKFKEQQKKQNAIPLEYEPGFAEGNLTREPAPLEMPVVDFPLEPKAVDRPLYNELESKIRTIDRFWRNEKDLEKKDALRKELLDLLAQRKRRLPTEEETSAKLTTEQEFYDLLKAEEAKLTPDVDTSEASNPFFKGDRNANVEVDSVSGRPIFPEETVVDNTLVKPNGEAREGVHNEGEPFVTINPDAIARRWLKLTPEKKTEMGLRSAEDLQNFVEMHERGHKFDSLEAGGHGRPGETIRDIERRVNNTARDNLSTFPKEEAPVATDAFQPAAHRTEYADKFMADLAAGKYNDPIARQKETGAKQRRLAKLNDKIKEIETTNPTNPSVLDHLENLTDLRDRMVVELEALDKLGKGLGKNKRSADFPDEVEFPKPTLPKTSPYTAKDQAKSDKANKFIGKGSFFSSTEAYRKAWGERANTGQYSNTDTVFVSVEGNRSRRVPFDKVELQKALDSGAKIVTDNSSNRLRSYNIGEREVAAFLIDHGYQEVSPGEWLPRKNSQSGPGGKQGGAVNFGFAEAIVDRFKKAKESIPSLQSFAEHIQRDPNDPVAKQLYEKYYGKDVKILTPEEIATAKIPGLKETISPELQPLDQMMDRWKTETDISDSAAARALRENLSSGGRMTALRTGNSFIDWNVENILGETRRAQVIIKRLQNNIKGEVKKITGSLLGQFKDKGKGIDSFVEAMGIMLKEEGKNTLVQASPEARLLVDKIRRTLDDLGTKIKAELESQGIKSFNWRPNYLAGVFFGPYRSVVKDATGKTIGVVAGRTMAEATAAIDHVKKNMPDAQFDVTQYNPKFDSGPGSLGARYGKASEVLEMLKNQDESAQLLQTTLSDYYAKVQEDYLGYKKHFIPKKGVFGSEGNRPWENARNNAYDLLEAQLGIIDHGYMWLAEQKLMKDFDQILTNPDIALPESKRYVNQYLDHAFGRTEDHVKILDSAIDYTARFMGISPAAFKETASILRNTALTGVLGLSGGFVLTQFVQVPQALAVGFTKAIGEGFHGSKSGASMVGGMDLVNGINSKFENMTPEGRYFFEHFTKNGLMDPHLVEHSLNRKVVTTTGMSPIQKAIWGSINTGLAGMKGISDVIGEFSIEKPEAWTRGTFAMTMAHFYKSAGMSLKEAAIKADKDTSTLFVDYSSQERAMMFKRMGELGKLASTVSTFKLNNLNQWFTFTNKKMYGTLAALALTSWFTTGLFGIPGGDEAEFGASFLKSKGIDIPTPREFMLAEIPGWASFGPLSKALTPFGGPDTSLHRKFAQDNVVPDDLTSFIYPLLSFYTNKIDKGIDYLKAPGWLNQEGAVLTRELVPGNLKYGVDYLGLTNSKGLTIDPNQIHNANPAHYDRTKNEWKLAAALGITSQREFKAKQMNQLDKISEKAWKTSTQSKIDSTISAFTNGDKEKFSKLYQEAVRYNPETATRIADQLNSRAIAASIPLEKMLELQFAKRATTPHGVKGLQQFKLMQENK